jgi:hypothetical protein
VENFKISGLACIKQMAIGRMSMVIMSIIDIKIYTLWSYSKIVIIFKITNSMVIVKVHHKKSLDLVTGFFLL